MLTRSIIPGVPAMTFFAPNGAESTGEPSALRAGREPLTIALGSVDSYVPPQTDLVARSFGSASSDTNPAIHTSSVFDRAAILGISAAMTTGCGAGDVACFFGLCSAIVSLVILISKLSVCARNRSAENVIVSSEKLAAAGDVELAASECRRKLRECSYNVRRIKKFRLAALATNLFMRAGNVNAATEMRAIASGYAFDVVNDWCFRSGPKVFLKIDGTPSDERFKKFATSVVNRLEDSSVGISSLSSEQKLRLGTVLLLEWLSSSKEVRIASAVDRESEDMVISKDWLIAMARERIQHPYIVSGQVDEYIRRISERSQAVDVDIVGSFIDAAFFPPDDEGSRVESSPTPIAQAPAIAVVAEQAAVHPGALAVESGVHRRTTMVLEELAVQDAERRDFDAFIPTVYPEAQVMSLFEGDLIIKDLMEEPGVREEAMRIVNSKEYQWDYLRDRFFNDSDLVRLRALLREFLQRQREEAISNAKLSAPKPVVVPVAAKADIPVGSAQRDRFQMLDLS